MCYIYIYVHMCLCVCIYIYVYIYIYIYPHIRMYTLIHKQVKQKDECIYLYAQRPIYLMLMYML